jgi:hypothetical protein
MLKCTYLRGVTGGAGMSVWLSDTSIEQIESSNQIVMGLTGTAWLDCMFDVRTLLVCHSGHCLAQDFF